MKQQVTDEMISALVDGELDSSKVSEVKSALLENPDQRRLYEELRGLNNLIGQGLEELSSDEFAQDLSNKLRAREKQLHRENNKQSFKPYLNLAAALVVGVSAGALTVHNIGVDDREAQDLKIALLEQRLKEPVMITSLDEKIEIVADKKVELEVLGAKSGNDLLQNSANNLLGKELVFSVKLRALNNALEASERVIESDDLPALANQKKSFDLAVELLRERGIDSLDEALPMLRGAYEGGHSGAGFVLLELVPPAEALDIYKVLINRLIERK
jgi:hypothetical protein